MNSDPRDFPRELAAFSRWREAQRNSVPSSVRRSVDVGDALDALLTFLAEGCDDGSLAARALALVFRLCPQRVEWPGIEERCRLRLGEWEAALRVVDCALPAARLDVRGERVRWTKAELKRAAREIRMRRLETKALRDKANREAAQAVCSRKAAKLWKARAEAALAYRHARFVEKRTGGATAAAAEMREFDRKLGIGGCAA